MKFKPIFSIGDLVYVDTNTIATILRTRANIEFLIEYEMSKKYINMSAKRKYWVYYEVLVKYNTGIIREQKLNNLLQ